MGRALLKMTALGTVLALAAAACGGGADNRDTQAPAPAEAEVERDRPAVKGMPPTPEGLVGIWHIPDTIFGNILIHLSPDGRFAGDNEGGLDFAPLTRGRYELDGRTISLGYTHGPCGRIEYEAGSPEDGRLHTAITVDGRGVCSAGLGTEWTWTRVSPSSPAGAQIAATEAPEEGPAPSSESQFPGIWLLEGTGHLLRFSKTGAYALADEGRLVTDPDDQGTFELDGKGRLTFTSGDKSRDCAEGASWVWKDLQLIFGAGALRGVESRDDCKKGLGPDLTWIRLSP